MCVYNSVDACRAARAGSAGEAPARAVGFKGFVVSDCGAVGDIYRSHKYVATQGAASVAAVKAVLTLTCGGEYVRPGGRSEGRHHYRCEITRAAERVFQARSGWACSIAEQVPYNRFRTARTIRRRTATGARAERESIVLLKNQDGFLR